MNASSKHKENVFVSNDYTGFLVNPDGKPSKNLADAIRKVGNASVAFTHSWLDSNFDDARATSQEAFEHLDFILSEFLRHRDDQWQHKASWETSSLYSALTVTVGKLVTGISDADEEWFRSLSQGNGALPAGHSPSVLDLETALNKWKHHDPIAVNFSVSLPYQHRLYWLTAASKGKATALIEIDVSLFCEKSKTVAATLV